MTEMATRPTTQITPPTPAEQGQSISAGLMSAEVMDRALAIGRLFAASGLFAGVKDEAKAFAKIAYGLALKIEPIIALQGIWEIQGRMEPSAQLRASIIRASGRYWYEEVTHTAEEAAIEFFGFSPVRNEWKSLGVSSYTIKEAQAAGLTGSDTWKKHPKTMLWWSAMRKGARDYCPELFIGDQLGSSNDGQVVAQGYQADAKQAAATAAPALADPMTDEMNRRKRRVFVLCKELGWDDTQRHSATKERFGRDSLNDLTLDELGQFIEILKETPVPIIAESRLATEEDDPFAPVPNMMAVLVDTIQRRDTPAIPRGDVAGITAPQTTALTRLKARAAISDEDLAALAALWSDGVPIDQLVTDDVTAFGKALKAAIESVPA